MNKFKSNLNRIGACLVLIVAGSAIFWNSASAQGGLIGADTANAMPGWFGTVNVHFLEELTPPKVVDATIDYAVYAPGQFNLSFYDLAADGTTHIGKDPSNGTRYVYRYQIHNNSGLDNDAITKLTLALVDLTSTNDAKNCKWIEPNAGGIYPAGGVAPTISSIAGNPPTSAYWSYPYFLQPGSDSKMLIFTSPNAPTWQRATVNSQSTVQRWVDVDGTQYNWWEGQLPSPVPEPSGFCCLVLLGIGLFVRRLARR
jgi:hypothetical protein